MNDRNLDRVLDYYVVVYCSAIFHSKLLHNLNVLNQVVVGDMTTSLFHNLTQFPTCKIQIVVVA